MVNRLLASRTQAHDRLRAFRRAGEQFRHLNAREPWLWPALPRRVLCAAVAGLALLLLWFFWLAHANDELDGERAREVALRADYQKKTAQAAQLDLLRKQREQIQRHVTLLEKQLPSRAEMDALLSDINQAGLGRGLQFELFRPGQVGVKDYYAELPIAVRVTGRYHEMGAFAADVANLSRIVTLNNLSITPHKDGGLSMDATARTFRYLDDDERAAQKRAVAAAGARKK